MTAIANVLVFWNKIPTIKGSKEHYLLAQKHDLQMLSVIHLIKLQNDI